MVRSDLEEACGVGHGCEGAAEEGMPGEGRECEEASCKDARGQSMGAFQRDAAAAVAGADP